MVSSFSFSFLSRHFGRLPGVLLPKSSFCTSLAVYHEKTTDEVKSHQANVMARGLPKKKPINGVKHIVVVASGKGGVGKSTTSVNLATALKLENPGKEVGLLDADIFGPSIPLMMNLDESPLLNEKNLMVPLQNYGVKCMSMGFLIDKNSPVIWRGLMVMQALDRLLRQVTWGTTDYLVIDTPPGTGDTHLSLLQNIPITGAVLISTPQSTALEVTRRGANMFKKLNIPIFGIIQNMSSTICPNCLSKVPLNSESAEDIIQSLNIPILADIPLDQSISHGANNGIPVVISHPDSTQASSYREVARKVITQLDSQEERK